VVWEREVIKIKERRRLVEKGGDPERISRQHALGKWTVRERIEALADPGSFREMGGLAGNDSYKDGHLAAVMPIGNVLGWCTVKGRKVIVSGTDSTVRLDLPEEAGEPLNLRRMGLGETAAQQWCVPYVRLLDGPGASVRHYETTGRPEFVSLNQWIEASSRIMAVVPVVSAVMGPAAGIYAIEACLCHFTVQVKGTGHVFPGGPPVVKAALGYEVGKEELGGWQMASETGVVDRVADSEKDALSLIRDFLGYLPDNVWEMPPRHDPDDDPHRRDEELLRVMPREDGGRYDPRPILEFVFDRNSVFEIAPSYGPSRITALARINGYPLGTVITNRLSPTHGALDTAGAEKVNRFVHLCDTFHLPVVCFVDEPGYATGADGEAEGIIRGAARLVQAIYQTRVPWIAFITGEVTGAAGSLAFRPGNPFKRYAWPSAKWHSTRPGRRVVPLNRMVDVFCVEDVVDPGDTRSLLCDFVEPGQRILAGQLGPGHGPLYRP